MWSLIAWTASFSAFSVAAIRSFSACSASLIAVSVPSRPPSRPPWRPRSPPSRPGVPAMRSSVCWACWRLISMPLRCSVDELGLGVGQLQHLLRREPGGLAEPLDVAGELRDVGAPPADGVDDPVPRLGQLLHRLLGPPDGLEVRRWPASVVSVYSVCAFLWAAFAFSCTSPWWSTASDSALYCRTLAPAASAARRASRRRRPGSPGSRSTLRPSSSRSGSRSSTSSLNPVSPRLVALYSSLPVSRTYLLERRRRRSAPPPGPWCTPRPRRCRTPRASAAAFGVGGEQLHPDGQRGDGAGHLAEVDRGLGPSLSPSARASAMYSPICPMATPAEPATPARAPMSWVVLPTMLASTLLDESGRLPEGVGALLGALERVTQTARSARRACRRARWPAP